MTTFDFGSGPVSAHQHENGGGWCADTAVVSTAAYIGPGARVVSGTIYGGDIHSGTIHGGTIWGGTICGGDIHGGDIHGGTICDHACIRQSHDYAVIGPIGSRYDLLTVYVDKDGAGWCATGCFGGTLGALLDAVDEVHGRASVHGRAYRTLAPLLVGILEERRAAAGR